MTTQKFYMHLILKSKIKFFVYIAQIVIISSLFILFPANIVFAICQPSSGYLAEYFMNDAIFSGKVMAISNVSQSLYTLASRREYIEIGGDFVTFDISQVWKGPKIKTITIYSGPLLMDGGGYPFGRLGEEYLVYAKKNYDQFEAYSCGPTHSLSDAQQEVNTFNLFSGIKKVFALLILLTVFFKSFRAYQFNSIT